MPTAIETESPIGVFTIGNFPDKYIKPSGDITGATDTARINAALSQKGTFIFDDNGDYSTNNTVTIDPTSVYFQGNGSVFNAKHNGVAFKIDSTGSTNYKRAKGRSIGDFAVRGNGSATSNGLLLDTPIGGDRSSSPSINNVCIENFNVGVKIGTNAYLVTLRDVDIGWCATGLQRLVFSNNGEQILYEGGSIFNGGRAFWFGAPNGELRLVGTSLDYNQQIGYTDAIVEAHGCHFESGSNQTTLKRQFEVDNGGTMTFIGGDCGLVDWNGGAINLAKPPAPNLFTVWGQGGAYYDYGLKCNFAQHFTDKLCNIENGYFRPTMGAYNAYAPKSANVALIATVTASSTHSSSYAVSTINNGDRAGKNWGVSGGWNDATHNTLPDFVTFKFKSPWLVKRVVLVSVQDNYQSPIEPTKTLTFTKYGIVDFKIQHLVSGNWVDLATITNNNLVMREIDITPTLITDLRVFITKTVDGWSRVVELEAWT